MERRAFLGRGIALSLSPLVSLNGLPTANGGALAELTPIEPSPEIVRLLMPRWRYPFSADEGWFSVAGLCADPDTASALLDRDHRVHGKIEDDRVDNLDAKFPGKRFLDVCLSRPKDFYPAHVLDIPPPAGIFGNPVVRSGKALGKTKVISRIYNLPLEPKPKLVAGSKSERRSYL